ncbi:Histidinol-phosphatase [Hexamita inflata]|uniref:Histidinol-phosphatase n=1 Tax=Hexamita inflata TaxID=28002 RepID=A0AA86PB51_9EUKA|nr:Histidinol-phosphatase [Hexamita inflata]CAI9935467.1 Histidinol-phosphatase [Hexamita inflata]
MIATRTPTCVVTLRTFVREYFTAQQIIKICADSPSSTTIHSLTMISAQATACPSLLSPLSQNFTAKNLHFAPRIIRIWFDYCSDARKTKAFVDLTADFDFITGSIHNDDELNSISFLSRRDYVSKYVQQWEEAVSTGWFQIMSHYDYFRAYFGDQWYLDNMKDDLEGGIIYLNEINKERARNGEELIALECNTGGIQYGDDKYMPTEQLLHLAINLGIPISIGSDCHYQNEVGRQFKQSQTCKIWDFKNCATSKRKECKLTPFKKRLNRINKLIQLMIENAKL